MVSTFLSYKMYAADLAKSTARTLQNVQVSREADYYRATIGSITSVDEFLDDQRLYAYAMKAHGLEDMTYAKAFMRKVLESDLTAKDSFVSKLVDQRYLAFAKSFNFAPSGSVETGLILAQDGSDETETTGLYSEQRVLKGAAAATEVDYYKTRLATLTSVNDLVNDPRLFAVALTAHGLDPDIASTAAIREVLLSDLSDPSSAANRFNDARYISLRSAFGFAANGSAAAGDAQTAAQLTATLDLYFDQTGNGSSPASAAFRTDAYRNQMAAVTSVDDLVNNELLRTYALTAAGIDPLLISPAGVRGILTSDLSDPQSVANTLGEAARALAQAFNFNTDGSLDAGEPAQSAAQETAFVDLYLQNYGRKVTAAEQTQTAYYTQTIAAITSVDGLLADSRLFAYVVSAFGLDPATEPKSRIRQVLISNAEDPASFARQLRDDRYTNLARAFNFGADGEALGAVRAQLDAAKTQTATRYGATLGAFEIDKTRGKEETQYYSTAIDNVGSVEDFLKDTRLRTYITRAYGFASENLSDQVLRQIFTSDLFDPASFVNKPENYRFREMAAAFNFESDGTAGRVSVGVAQDERDVLATQDLFVRQTMEQEAGQQSEGVRLALYFQRKASTITSAFSILADKALLEVVMTGLGLPDSVAQSDVDKLAALIEKRMDLADFKDPAKVEKFIARFTALYDIDNPQNTQSSAISLLLGQDDGSIFSESLLTSLQAVQRNR